MALDQNEVAAMENRLEWVEPEIKQLDVRETAYNPGSGGDPIYSQYGNAYPDCTRS